MTAARMLITANTSNSNNALFICSYAQRHGSGATHGGSVYLCSEERPEHSGQVVGRSLQPLVRCDFHLIFRNNGLKIVFLAPEAVFSRHRLVAIATPNMSRMLMISPFCLHRTNAVAVSSVKKNGFIG